MFPVIDHEQKPVKCFKDRAAALVEAERITHTPRSGAARVQFVGCYDAWIVEVTPRVSPYANPATLREDGTIAKHPNHA